jgi:hypothetical protein
MFQPFRDIFIDSPRLLSIEEQFVLKILLIYMVNISYIFPIPSILIFFQKSRGRAETWLALPLPAPTVPASNPGTKEGYSVYFRGLSQSLSEKARTAL